MDEVVYRKGRMNSRKIENIIFKAQIIVWTMLLFCFYFQVPFKRMATCIVPLFVVYILLNFCRMERVECKKDGFLLYTILTLYLCSSAFFSLLKGAQSGKVVRFFLILMIIPLCFLARSRDFKWEYKILMYLSVLKSLYLIYMACRMIIAGTYLPFRAYAETNGFGDMYFVYGFIPRIQIYGNALLVMAFIVNVYYRKKITLQNAIILLGIAIAGNFAFILGIFTYMVYVIIHNYIKNPRKLINRMVIILSVVMALIFISYANIEMTRKANGSNSYKITQASMLINTNALIGEGLGSSVSENINLGVNPDTNYYELQTLYIYYQIGMVGISLFYIVTLYFCWLNGRDVLILYLIYLLYTFFNPYCFDTTQMISIILLMNTKSIISRQESIQIIQ